MTQWKADIKGLNGAVHDVAKTSTIEKFLKSVNDVTKIIQSSMLIKLIITNLHSSPKIKGIHLHFIVDPESERSKICKK